MNEETNNGDLEERIRVGRICQDLVQVKERALCGFGAFGEIINLSLICCIQKEEDKRYMNMLSGWDAHFNRPLNALTFSSSGIFLKSDPEMRTQNYGERVYISTFGFVRQGLPSDYALLLILDNLNTLHIKGLLQLGKVDI